MFLFFYSLLHSHLPKFVSPLLFVLYLPLKLVSFLWRFDSCLFSLFINCCCSVAQSCPTLCDPMDCSTPGFPVHHRLLELAQTHVLASVLPLNIQDWFPLELTGLISSQSKELSRVFSNTTVQKHQFFNSPKVLSKRIVYIPVSIINLLNADYYL